MRISPLGNGNLPLRQLPQLFKTRVVDIATPNPMHCLWSITEPQRNTQAFGVR
ncbi:hypothetical protein [Laspinema olomoucense]|uniref:hypothetical protein n=1 Tax=Laspinema olomoucense TaxID=3231600 RepID=UPI0021BBADDD|nr:hypothetical protein [Laspinema sp. D3d]